MQQQLLCYAQNWSINRCIVVGLWVELQRLSEVPDGDKSCQAPDDV